jgi:hypothetical protein
MVYIMHIQNNRNALHLLDQDSDSDDSLDFEKSANENKNTKAIARKKGACTSPQTLHVSNYFEK